MPVVKMGIRRFAGMVGAGRQESVSRLPYVGLDIEGVDGDSIRVEYSPNRPDFGTDYGIARSLKGLMGKAVGLPTYPVSRSATRVDVEKGMARLRPFISCAVVEGLGMDAEDVRQLLSLQEDLHNGIGRRRRLMAIGLHDAGRVVPPVAYCAKPGGFRFTPLGEDREMSISEVLSGTARGAAYSGSLLSMELFPIIIDSAGTVLSFPPIVNGRTTAVGTRTKSVLVEVTGVREETVEDALAIMATTLGEMGGRVRSVKVVTGKESRWTPDLSPNRVPLDEELVREVTGLSLTSAQIRGCLAKSRLGLASGKVLVPRYRTDLLHAVDVAEEVALGYGIDRMTPLYPPSGSPGGFHPFEQLLDRTADVMAESGLIEMMTQELTSRERLFGAFAREGEPSLSVEEPKSSERSVLRDTVLPSLLGALSANVKEEYPQKVFEIGRVFERKGSLAAESWNLACVIAHSHASFTEAKAQLESMLGTLAGASAGTPPVSHWAFSDGRAASIVVGGERMGVIGEVKPEALVAFGLGVPASAFELSLSQLSKRLKYADR
jgi:phenylalanyl-tRNA synthetase beta chain